jgi:hypothetical protein
MGNLPIGRGGGWDCLGGHRGIEVELISDPIKYRVHNVLGLL